jgi:hypothetical protein
LTACQYGELDRIYSRELVYQYLSYLAEMQIANMIDKLAKKKKTIKLIKDATSTLVYLGYKGETSILTDRR